MIKKFAEVVKKVFQDEEGQGMTEYILIVVLIAIAAIASFVIYQNVLKSKVQDAASELEKAE